jgi:UDP-N-acetylmuramoyl-tripeptide--D-alanyl-D-alanine ligase
MLSFSPGDLAMWTGGTWSASPTRTLRGFSIDSRRVLPGDVFVALRTERRDGHDFVADAVTRGAGAVIVARQVDPSLPALVVEDPERALQDCAREHRRRFQGPVIGITGSCGKTSTKDLLRLLLGPERTLATEANLNNTLGVPLTLLQIDPAKHAFAVIEAGINQKGEMDTLTAMIEPSHGIVTMVGLAHASGLGDEQSIAVEKAKMPAAVAPGGLVLFPQSCRQYPPFSSFAAQTWTASFKGEGGTIQYFFHSEACDDIRLDRDRDRDSRETQTMDPGPREGCRLDMALPGPVHFSLRVPAVTSGVLGNAVLVLALAHHFGVAEDSLQGALDAWKPSRHRGELRTFGSQVFYIDCYNANPASMVDAVRFFARRFSARPRLYVLGSMRELGPYGVESHRAVGRELKLGLDDRAIFIGHHAKDLHAGALAEGNDSAQMVCFAETAEAQNAVGAFEGAILLKSSRMDALETLLPNGNHSEGVAC